MDSDSLLGLTLVYCLQDMLGWWQRACRSNQTISDITEDPLHKMDMKRVSELGTLCPK